MRYYKIDIDNGGLIFQSYANGQNLRGALLVELDIPVAPFHQPRGSAYVKIWGLGNDLLGQAHNLNNKAIKVYGGFQKGLPLANPQQAGLLVQGYIFQAFGNNIGVERSLDIIIAAGDAPQTSPNSNTVGRNITLNWKKGNSLVDALTSTLKTAFPGFTVKADINSSLTATQDEPGYFGSLFELGKYVHETSLAIVGQNNYQGVFMTLTGKTFNVYDGSKAPANVKTVSFKDLIGQPTWINAPSIQFKCGMRADLSVGDAVKMPPSFVTNTAAAATSLINQRVTFQGQFQISDVRHVGHSRQPSAESWVTVFNAFPMQVVGQ